MDNCLFCKIAGKELSASFVYEDDTIVAFNDIHPAAPVHVLLIPRKHIPSVAELSAEDDPLVAKLVVAAKKLAVTLGIADAGYRLVFNVRSHAGQVIDHVHLHLLGGKRLGPLA